MAVRLVIGRAGSGKTRRCLDAVAAACRAARHAGLATKLDATFADFERNGRDLADLATLLEDLNTIVTRTGEQQSLYDKVHDLRLIYQAYTNYVGQERLDRHHRLQQVL